MRENQRICRLPWARESRCSFLLVSSIWSRTWEDLCRQFRITLFEAGHHPSGGGEGNLKSRAAAKSSGMGPPQQAFPEMVCLLLLSLHVLPMVPSVSPANVRTSSQLMRDPQCGAGGYTCGPSWSRCPSHLSHPRVVKGGLSCLDPPRRDGATPRVFWKGLVAVWPGPNHGKRK